MSTAELSTMNTQDGVGHVTEVHQIPLSEIFLDDELNCRGQILPIDVLDLVSSIREVGLNSAITVQPYAAKPPYKFRIISGHRRYTAFQVLSKTHEGFSAIPASVRTGLTEMQIRTINLQENLKRKDLTMLQEAIALKKYRDAGYTMKEIADMVGMSTGWVQVRSNLLALPDEIQQAAGAGLLTQEQVKDIFQIPDVERQYEAVRQIKESRLRGQKRGIKIKTGKKKNPLAKKVRLKEEAFTMQEHIIDTVGPNFGTRCIAWMTGEISDMELYQDIKKIADEKNIPYSPPLEDYT